MINFYLVKGQVKTIYIVMYLRNTAFWGQTCDIRIASAMFGMGKK